MTDGMRNLAYGIVHGAFHAMSLLPYRALYLVSDLMYPLVYHVARYRRAVVRRNIGASFPEKSPGERLRIERGFYRWLCDCIVETVKLLSVRPATLSRHIEFRNFDQIEDCFDRGQSVAAILGHYCNWEMLSTTALCFDRHREAVCGLIYHPLRNAVFDRLLVGIREGNGGRCVPKNGILRQLAALRGEGTPYLFGYISDQAPKFHDIHLWLDFLGQDTPVFTGGERIMRRMGDAVFYADMERPERGRYVCTFRLLSGDAGQEPEFGITRRFFSMLEDSVRRDPHLYLWTHDRWKRTRGDFERLYRVENGRVVGKGERP